MIMTRTKRGIRVNSDHAQNGGAVGAIWRSRLIEAARRNCHDHDCVSISNGAKTRIAFSQSLGLGMAEPEIATHRKRRLAVFLDGTWNAVDANTNVWRMKSLCATKGTDDVDQLIFYAKGVNGFWGGVFGKGLDDVIKAAYEWLIDQYVAGDEIFIFGFSRGAYAARSLAGLITKCGLLQAGGALGVKQLYTRYQHSEADTIWHLFENPVAVTDREEQWLIKYSQRVSIKVVGVWDTVGALGLPFGNIPGISRSSFKWLHTGLRRPLENAYHAIAIDEHRRAFSPTLWTVRKPKEPNDAETPPPRTLNSVEQRWFVGAHANVGGGCDSDLLAQIPLRWMMQKASMHGLAFKHDVDLDGDVLTAKTSNSYADFMYGIYSDFSDRYYRPIGEAPRVLADGTHSNVNETIDASVFNRWQTDQSYRPSNLTAWAQLHKADPMALKNSVRADQPQTSVPD